jgi:peptidyl-prolyl cis-trans isomerase SurA
MMPSLILTIALTPALAVAQDSTAVQARTRIDHVVAMVQDEPILRSEVRQALERAVAAGVQQRPADSASDHRLMRTLLDSIIDSRLLAIAAKDAKVEVNEQMIEARLDEYMRQVRSTFTNDTTYAAALRQAGFASIAAFRENNLAELRADALRGQYISQLRDEGKLPTPAVTEADIQEVWEQTRPGLGRRLGGFTWRQIVLRVTADSAARMAAIAKAESLRAEITSVSEPDSQLARFIEVAKRESMDGTRERGGDLDWRRRGDLVPEFERFAFGLPVNSISPAFETSFGFHILRVDRAETARVRVRHILIVPETDSADVARTMALADSLAAALRAGASFDSLAARYHDDAELRSQPNPIPPDSLAEPFANAVRGLESGGYAKPFAFPNRSGQPRVWLLVVTGFEAERDYTLDDYRARIRDELVFRKSMRRLLDQLRQEYYVSIRL